MALRSAALLLACATCNAFLANKALPKAARALKPLKSMDEDDDGSWPSDSSDEVIDVVGAAVEDVDALKRSLLLALGGVKLSRCFLDARVDVRQRARRRVLLFGARRGNDVSSPTQS